jgi:putative ABC transport system permease protein
MALNGAQSKQGGPFLAGVAVVLMSTVPTLRALGLPERAAFSLGGGALVVWCLLPFSVYDAIVPGMTMNFSVWVIVGILLVIGSSWVVIYNAPAILAAVTWVFGRIASLRPVLKTSLAQPLHNRFRTGTTIALFTLVVFTLIVGATTSNAFLNATNDLASYGGGFQVLAQTSPLNPITDMTAALKTAKGINPTDITSYSGQSYIPVDARQGSAGTFQAYPLRGLDSTFTAKTTYGFSVRASGYTTDRQVWQAVATHPGYAVIDPFVVPHRANFSFAVMPKFRLHGFAVEDKTFTPRQYRSETRKPRPPAPSPSSRYSKTARRCPWPEYQPRSKQSHPSARKPARPSGTSPWPKASTRPKKPRASNQPSSPAVCRPNLSPSFSMTRSALR